MSAQQANSDPMTAVVLVHGLLGFGQAQKINLKRAGNRRWYFHGLEGRLGKRVYAPPLPGNGDIEHRAQALAETLASMHEDRIALVAHSMGGLDSRYLIQELDKDHRVAELITLSTPHRGSPLADYYLAETGPFSRLVRRLTLPALTNLTTEYCAAFNERCPDRPDVRYRSYAGHVVSTDMPVWLRPWTRLIESAEGANDGVVSVSSSQWGEFQGQLAADHFALAGWNVLPLGRKTPRFDHLGFYQGLVKGLKNTSGNR